MREQHAAGIAATVREHDVHLRGLIQVNPLAVVVIDAHDLVQMCNPAFEKMFGYACRSTTTARRSARTASSGTSRNRSTLSATCARSTPSSRRRRIRRPSRRPRRGCSAPWPSRWTGSSARCGSWTRRRINCAASTSGAPPTCPRRSSSRRRATAGSRAAWDRDAPGHREAGLDRGRHEGIPVLAQAGGGGSRPALRLQLSDDSQR